VRIYHRASGREAQPRKTDGLTYETYTCFPPGRNDIDYAEKFRSIEEAAIFLLKNPDWKIWCAAKGSHNDGQLSNDLVIEGSFDRDDLKLKGIL